jgi:colanic acid biosynthesis glycosyl transferase WcaI
MVEVLARSHDVVVVVPRPSYPDPSFYDKQSTLEGDRLCRYRVERPLEFVPHSRSLAIRAVREQVMALRLAVRAAREPADIVVSSSPSMFLGPVSWLLARTKSSRFVWDIRDIGWDYAGESRMMSAWMRPLVKILQRYMWAVVARADLIVVASRGGAERVSQNVPSGRKILLVDNSVAKELLDDFKICQERVTKSRSIVSYVGLIGDPQAVGTLVDVARILPAVDFLIVGEGPERSLVEKRVQELQLPNVKLTGYLPRPDVREVYRRSDILFAQLKDAPTLNSTSLPSKLYEYMATGKPIVYAGKGLAAETVDEIGCGVSVSPERSDLIAHAIAELLGDEERMSDMGRKGRIFVETGADRETAFEELVAALRFTSEPTAPVAFEPDVAADDVAAKHSDGS